MVFDVVGYTGGGIAAVAGGYSAGAVGLLLLRILRELAECLLRNSDKRGNCQIQVESHTTSPRLRSSMLCFAVGMAWGLIRLNVSVGAGPPFWVVTLLVGGSDRRYWVRRCIRVIIVIPSDLEGWIYLEGFKREKKISVKPSEGLREIGGALSIIAQSDRVTG